MAGLTDKQKAFVAEYLVDLDPVQAAIRAGYSVRAAASVGPAMRVRGAVARAIHEAQAQRQQRTGITADRVVAELAHIAFGDVRAVVDWGPEGLVLRESSTLSDAEAATVAEVYESVTRDGGTKKVKQHDKLKALDMLGRHLGMWEKREIPHDEAEISHIRVMVEDARIAGDADGGRIATADAANAAPTARAATADAANAAHTAKEKKPHDPRNHPSE